ncbi:hypothetical protein HPB47_002469 [Ixodes persulcatus]|uniref:Uncharacterized protein n=1 Tax=Ixodes persulcatus TaxID=34615 RepID=A0AC60PMT1_IXOPE|nr:hypothetical protein HPB47_002469 [Ixodes persulcatus]
MNFLALSELEHRILDSCAELGVVPYKDTPRKRPERGGEASRPQFDDAQDPGKFRVGLLWLETTGDKFVVSLLAKCATGIVRHLLGSAGAPARRFFHRLVVGNNRRLAVDDVDLSVDSTAETLRGKDGPGVGSPCGALKSRASQSRLAQQSRVRFSVAEHRAVLLIVRGSDGTRSWRVTTSWATLGSGCSESGVLRELRRSPPRRHSGGAPSGIADLGHDQAHSGGGSESSGSSSSIVQSSQLPGKSAARRRRPAGCGGGEQQVLSGGGVPLSAARRSAVLRRSRARGGRSRGSSCSPGSREGCGTGPAHGLARRSLGRWGRGSADKLRATQGIPHQTTTAPLSANSAAWTTPRLARIAAKNCDHPLRHCEFGNELSPHSGGNNNPPQIPSLLSHDNSHRTSRTNNSHLERIIYEMCERLNNRLIDLDPRIHAIEEAKRQARKRPKQCTLPRTSGDTSPPLQIDDD